MPADERVVRVHHIATGSIFKLVVVGLLIVAVPLGIGAGISGFFGADTLSLNDRPIHGVAALVVGPLLSVALMTLLALGIGAAMSVGLWVFSLVRPLTIRFRALDGG